jgi:hypothetical protein
MSWVTNFYSDMPVKSPQDETLVQIISLKIHLISNKTQNPINQMIYWVRWKKFVGLESEQ